MKVNHRISKKLRRSIRVRKALRGTALRPRVSVFRSNQHVYVQVINDELGVTLASASDAKLAGKGNKSERAALVANQVAEALKKAKIEKLVFDRGPYKYHGRVKVVAETLRSAGLDL